MGLDDRGSLAGAGQMRRLTILSVAYKLAPVGPDAVGGSEQVLSALDHYPADFGLPAPDIRSHDPASPENQRLDPSKRDRAAASVAFISVGWGA